MGEYSLAKTGEYPRIFPNFQNCARCVKDLKDNKDNSLHLGRKYARIFVLGHYLFLVAHSFPRATLSENCSLLGTDNVRGQISEHIFAPNGGYCLYICDFAKTWLPGFRLDSGKARIQAKPASQNLGGAPSRLAWVYRPDLDLSAGGLFGVQQ